MQTNQLLYCDVAQLLTACWRTCYAPPSWTWPGSEVAHDCPCGGRSIWVPGDRGTWLNSRWAQGAEACKYFVITILQRTERQFFTAQLHQVSIPTSFQASAFFYVNHRVPQLHFYQFDWRLPVPKPYISFSRIATYYQNWSATVNNRAYAGAISCIPADCSIYRISDERTRD